MYTRVYQGKGQPLPQDYHGTAFREEEKTPPPSTEEAPTPVQEEYGREQKGDLHSASCDAGQEKTHPKEDVREGWRADILLLAICALLVQCEEADTRLLALLLLLLLSPNT